MAQFQHRITIRTQGKGLYEITQPIAHWIEGLNATDGLLTVFIRHTSASLIIQENADPAVQRDLEGFLAIVVIYFCWVSSLAKGICR